MSRASGGQSHPSGGQSRASGGQPALGNGTPEQVHLTWGDDPATSVVVSWGSPARAARPRVRIGQRVILATEQAYTDEATGKVVWTYHAPIPGLRAGATYAYAVTADNDSNARDPFTSTFRTAPASRAAFRFTSFGDLALPDDADAAYTEAGYPAGTVESFQPLFHLMNGGLCGKATAWRGFANGSQFSAASRPWMPVPGLPGLAGPVPYLARYALPSDGAPESAGRWYSFQVGTVVFVCLDSADVTSGTGEPAAQTRWLERTLARARADASVDWVIASSHHAACSSAADCYLGIREEWLPLLDRYEADLLLSGHGAGYERSFPCRGHDPLAGRLPGPDKAVETRRPRAVARIDSDTIDTSQGTVHLVLGSGTGEGAGGGARDGGHAGSTALVRPRAGAALIEDATWSARRDPGGGYGIMVFDVDPGGEAGDHASIKVSCYRSPATGSGKGFPLADDLTHFESFTLVRPRPDRRPGSARDEATAALT
jgi:Purple acid Phosphatase, N-terminal domain